MSRWGILALSLFFVFSISSNAEDLGFRYKNGKCENAKGQTGYNPYYIGQCGDLSGVVIGNFDLSGSDLRGANFTGADLRNTDLNGANLEGTILNGTIISGADLSGAMIKNISAKELRAVNVKFIEAVIDNVNLSKADMQRSDFSLAIISKTNLDGANWTEIQAAGTELKNLSMKGAILAKAKFDGSEITNVDFSNLKGEGVQFVNVKAKDLMLKGADLSQARINRSEFMNSNFQQIKADNASFTGGFKATGSDFSKSSLRYSDFSGAALTQTNFSESKLSSARFVGADLTRSKIMNSVIRSTDFTNAKLQGVRWDKSIFSKSTKFPYTPDDAKKLGMEQTNLGEYIYVYYNTTYVNVADGDLAGEASNMRKILIDAYPGKVKTFTAMDAASFDRTLQDAYIVVFPEQEVSVMTALFNNNVNTLMMEFMDSGGKFVMATDGNGGHQACFNAIFSENITSQGANGDPYPVKKDMLNKSTLNGLNVSQLPMHSAHRCYTQLPNDALELFKRNSCTAMFEKRVGDGSFYMMGWTWYNSKPYGAVGDEWNAVLKFLTKPQ